MSKKKQKKDSGFCASFAVRVWVDIDNIQARSLDEALAIAKGIAVADCVDMCGGSTVIDSYIDVVSVTNTKILDKVSP